MCACVRAMVVCDQRHHGSTNGISRVVNSARRRDANLRLETRSVGGITAQDIFILVHKAQGDEILNVTV